MGLFDASAFMPHGHCYLWTPLILWLHVGSDALIAAAYYSIPVALAVLVRRRRDLYFRGTFHMFAGFIFLCGTTHVVAIWTTWYPAYLAEGLLKAATAGVSVATALALWPLLPKVLSIPSTRDLAEANAALEGEVARREAGEAELREVNSSLEELVRERTAHLETRTRELERSNLAMSQFAYVASHDLREPLRSVESFCGLLEERYGEQLDERGRKWLRLASADAARLQLLVTDLLEYSRLQRSELDLAPVDLDELVAETLASLSALRVEKEAEFSVASLPTVLGDRGLLSQVFQNLFANAIKYAGDGPPRVRVGSEPGADGTWVISVTDSGPGIEARFQERIFEPFRRLQRQQEGSGMGLSICKGIVGAHGGRIWVESAPGEGASFRFSLRGAGTA